MIAESRALRHYDCGAGIGHSGNPPLRAGLIVVRIGFAQANNGICPQRQGLPSQCQQGFPFGKLVVRVGGCLDARHRLNETNCFDDGTFGYRIRGSEKQLLPDRRQRSIELVEAVGIATVSYTHLTLPTSDLV